MFKCCPHFFLQISFPNIPWSPSSSVALFCPLYWLATVWWCCHHFFLSFSEATETPGEATFLSPPFFSPFPPSLPCFLLSRLSPFLPCPSSSLLLCREAAPWNPARRSGDERCKLPSGSGRNQAVKRFLLRYGLTRKQFVGLILIFFILIIDTEKQLQPISV